MQILAHRGYWLNENEKNTLVSFERAFKNGYGIETDIRDFNGKLVISHNIADENCIPLDDLFTLYNKIGNNLPLAINIKADGLQDKLLEYLNKYNIYNYFVFDMSVPEQVVYIKKNIKTFTRQSEYEQTSPLYNESQGVWMDEFNNEWITSSIIKAHLENQKEMGIISSEIHSNQYDRIWSILKEFSKEKNIMLCTDIPKIAEEYFYGKN